MNTRRTAPRGARHRLLVVATVALLATTAVACSKDDAGDDAGSATTTAPKATTTEAAPSTTTTKPPTVDPMKVPADTADMTVAYAQAVLDDLYRRYRDAIQDAHDQNTFEGDVLVQFSRVYTPLNRDREIASLNQLGGPTALKAHPGKVEATVKEVVEATSTCMLIKGRINYSPVTVKHTATVDPFFFKLELNSSPAPGEVPWRIDLNHGSLDGKPLSIDSCTQ